eukprot:15455382-Alexandrium_andersonii.AAC.1
MPRDTFHELATNSDASPCRNLRRLELRGAWRAAWRCHVLCQSWRAGMPTKGSRKAVLASLDHRSLFWAN